MISYILERHNTAEEEPGGLYDFCEPSTQVQNSGAVRQLIATKVIPVRPPNPAPIAIEAAKRALARTSYDFDEIVGHTQ